ncbi:MAG: serine/threonine protein kinase [Deltaproteobacteria bacterium]|nr:serine/threonine protein kinase [Deltaproteobacteria bacterium]
MVSRRPQQFGKYILLDRVAIGGMAEIFRAKATGAAQFEKILAIKRIHPNMSDDKDFIKMFIDEAKISGQLAHQNIAQIFELGRIEGHHFIAMEYIWGKDLLAILTKFKKQRAFMNPFQAAFITSRICEALDYAHKKKDAEGATMGIIHRDVSPQNILIGYEGEVKIIDFGIAKARDRSSHTAAGVLKGKFGYMSPEQVRGLPIDRRSDVFAIGTLLFEMLTSRPLFHGNSDLEVLEKVRNVEILTPRQVNPKIPEGIEKIILKALARDVEDRYAWASDMQDDLEAFIHSTTPTYTGKRLGTWMKKVFAQELGKEKETLEQMLAMTQEPANTAKPQVEEDGETVIMMDDEDDGGRGNLAFNDTLKAGAQAQDIYSEKTMFLDEEEDDIGEAKTMFLEDDDDDLGEQKTVLFDDDDPSMQIPGAPSASPSPASPMRNGPSVPPGRPQGPGPMPSPLPAPQPPSPNRVESLPDFAIPGLSTPAKSETAKDRDISSGPDNKKQMMILGGSIAGALIVGMILGKLLFSGGSSAQAKDETSLILIPAGSSPAVLTIDGHKKDEVVKPGESLILRKIAPGSYKTTVKGSGYKESTESIEVPEGTLTIKVIRPVK